VPYFKTPLSDTVLTLVHLQEPNRPAGAEFLSIQTTISLADDLGLIPEADYQAVINQLVNDILQRSNGHLDCGV
jgi:hypothetical protein